MSETKKQKIEREIREQMEAMRGKSIPVPADYVSPRPELRLKEELREARRELRDLLHSDFCGRRCVPRCAELTALLGEPPPR